jgi:hypothetical protein
VVEGRCGLLGAAQQQGRLGLGDAVQLPERGAQVVAVATQPSG